MKGVTENLIARAACNFIYDHWPEEWEPWEEVDMGQFAKKVDAAVLKAWDEFQHEKNANRTAAAMDARPE